MYGSYLAVAFFPYYSLRIAVAVLEDEVDVVVDVVVGPFA
jgi:hypothetical protein